MTGRRLLYTAEAAELVGVSAGTVRSWASRGKLRVSAIDRHKRPLYLDTDVYLTERAMRPRGGLRRKLTAAVPARNINPRMVAQSAPQETPGGADRCTA